MNRSAVRIRPSAPCRGVAQFGSALGSGPRGRWFKSSHLDQSRTSPLAKANKRGNSASLFCLPSAFRSSLRSMKLVPFEMVTALCVRLFRPRFARPYKSSHLDQSGTSPLAKADHLKTTLLLRQEKGSGTCAKLPFFGSLQADARSAGRDRGARTHDLCDVNTAL